MKIRSELQSDVTEIVQVIEQAFGRDDEARLVGRLRQAGDATISLVAVIGGAVVGHVLFSPMAAPFRALGLAPVSVLPAHQRRGVGAALIEAGITRARDEGWLRVLIRGRYTYFGVCLR